MSGRVQGVGFRYFVTREAGRQSLAGWTRNLPDGRVEVFAQGTGGGLEELARSLAAGPPMSRVDLVEAFEREPDSSLTGFEVRY